MGNWRSPMEIGSSRRAVMGTIVLIVAVVGVALVAHRGSATRSEGVGALAFAHQAKFSENPNGEAERGVTGEDPGNTPASEQVADRAYPRNYVDDRLARRSGHSFAKLPSRLPRSAFSSRSDYRQSNIDISAWTNLGPRTPYVAPEATQFYDLEHQQGTPTVQSGRVTAMAIDPNCGQVDGHCRIWVAAAGGGIWRTGDALADSVTWHAPPDDLPTNAFGSLILDPNDPTGNTLYAGSGEPNGSGDSEAGLGLFRSTDGGQTWQLVPGSADVATNRSIGSIAVRPGNPDVIYIGTDVARHGSSASNGGRRTPPSAPRLGVYKSIDGGNTFHLLRNLSDQTPANPTPPGTGADWFQGGINKLEIDPNNPSTMYAAVVGYGVWRSNDRGVTWHQVFHTINQTDFQAGTGDFFGDRTEFDLVGVNGHTTIYLGDSSDDFALDGRPGTIGADFWRVRRADTKGAGELVGTGDNAGWTFLTSRQNGTNAWLTNGWCQNGQCGYDAFVVSPPGQPNTVWLGGSMAYDELPIYGGIPRSNGRGVIRSTNANLARPDITWQDMTQDARPPGVREGMHPDQHAIVFDPQNPNIAFVGSDGGVIKVDVRDPVDRSDQCASRTYQGQPLSAPDLQDCQTLLSAIPSKLTPLNTGLNDIQFQSLSVNPDHPAGELLGGTQDNGTFSFTGTPTWEETISGDGGQSGFDVGDPTIRYHNYYDATPDVNFQGNDPRHWLFIGTPLQETSEARSFYVPFIADPTVPGRAFEGLQHVWRTDDNGGDQAYLEQYCNWLEITPGAPFPGDAQHPCGDWQPMGEDLTSTDFGNDKAGQYVVATTRAPGDDSTLWAGTRIGRVFVTKNADAADPANVTFDRIDTTDEPGRFVSGISVDPSDANHAIVSYSGYDAYTPQTPGHVFDVQYDPNTHSATFTDISYDLGDQPVTGVAFDGATGDIYAATDFGVAKLPSGATSWQNAAPGMPAVAVYGLTLSPDGGILYAATHGRGAYALRLAN